MSQPASEVIATPDSPAYVDLSLYDADEQDLVDRALAAAQLVMPDWVPREGNTEVVLIEALALLVGEVVYAINRMPATVLQGLLVLYGIQRDTGVRATGRVEFTLSDSFGHTVPGGTRIRATVESTGQEVDLITMEPLEVLASSTTGQVDVQAVDPGDDVNGLAVGTVLEMVDAVAYVNRVEVVTAVTGGRGAEADEQLYDRGASLLSRLVSTLVLPSHFTAAALEDPSVGRATTVDMYDPGQAGNPGDHQGHVSIAVASEAGAVLSGGVKTAVQASLAAKAHAGLSLHIVDPTITAVAVAATVTSTLNDPATVQANVEAAIEAYLNPLTWPWGGTVYRNELIALVDRVPGVGRVVALTLDAGTADVALAGVAPLADAGAIAVTVA